jgi:hypothetical protein
VAYDCPRSLKTYVLFFPQSLYIPRLDNHLINPFQLRDNGVQVYDTPLIHLPKELHTQECHSIISLDPFLHIPLHLKGTMSSFHTRKPTWDEVRDTDQTTVVHINMTSDTNWEPREKRYNYVEAAMREHLNHGYTLHVQEPRTISTLQVRGQELDTGMDLSLPLTEEDVTYIEGTGDDPEDEADARGVAPVKRYVSAFKTLQSRDQINAAALDVDKYAQLMMDELGVVETPEDLAYMSSEQMEEMSRKLAGAKTIRKRK